MSLNQSPFRLFENIKAVITETQLHIVRNVKQAMVIAYFQIGRMIVEDEQLGRRRADYAEETISRLSNELNNEFGKGYSVSNLEYMRSFYLTYQDCFPIGDWGNHEGYKTPITDWDFRKSISFKLDALYTVT